MRIIYILVFTLFFTGCEKRLETESFAKFKASFNEATSSFSKKEKEDAISDIVYFIDPGSNAQGILMTFQIAPNSMNPLNGKTLSEIKAAALPRKRDAYIYALSATEKEIKELKKDVAAMEEGISLFNAISIEKIDISRPSYNNPYEECSPGSLLPLKITVKNNSNKIVKVNEFEVVFNGEEFELYPYRNKSLEEYTIPAYKMHTFDYTALANLGDFNSRICALINKILATTVASADLNAITSVKIRSVGYKDEVRDWELAGNIDETKKRLNLFKEGVIKSESKKMSLEAELDQINGN